MLTWTLHEDKKGLSATGKEQSYWICETSRLRVQEGRDKPMALFVRREKKVKTRKIEQAGRGEGLDYIR